jgi:hypothetical protein
MKRVWKFFATAVAMLLVSGTALAQAYQQSPGYIDLAKSGLVGDAAPEVEVFLEKVMLQVGAAALAELDPSVGELINMIDLCQVKVFPAAGLSEQYSSGSVSAYTDQLRKEGWSPMVNVPEGGVEFLLKTTEDRIAGFVGFVADEESLVFINLSGDIDPITFGKTIGVVVKQFSKGGELPFLDMMMGGAFHDEEFDMEEEWGDEEWSEEDDEEWDEEGLEDDEDFDEDFDEDLDDEDFK